MKVALLLRSGSGTIQTLFFNGSPKTHPSDQVALAGISFPSKNSASFPRSTLHFQKKKKNEITDSIRRSVSDTALIPSEISLLTDRISIDSSPARRAEEEDLLEQRTDLQKESEEDGSLILKRNGLDLCLSDRVAEIFRENDVLMEELEFSGGGMGKGRKAGGGHGGGKGGDGAGSFSGGNADQAKIGAYYKQMLKEHPGNPLLLRNYGKFLHEVEKDYVGAEECYGRAILASPGDGEVLSLYGKLVWETQRDQNRAQSYFDNAIKACPDDSYVLGSYAHFLWDADEEEEEEEEEGREEEIAESRSCAPVLQANSRTDC